MKRSEALAALREKLHGHPMDIGELIYEQILDAVEEIGMHLVDDQYGVTGFEPEEGWDVYLAEQDRKAELRDFKVIPDTTRGTKIAQQFLDGKDFLELANEYNVTIERIRQIVCKYRKKYQQKGVNNE